MQALVLDDTGAISVRGDFPRPTSGPGEALVKVTRAGICNTDLELIKGYMKFTGVIGHEFVGVVEDIDDGLGLRKGQRVVGEINLPCNDCPTCDHGGTIKRNHCEKRQVLGILNKDGTYAQYLTLPLGNLYAVPDSVPDVAAVFAEPLAAAFRIVEQGLIPNGATVAVIGDGKLGLLIAEVLSQLKLKRLCLFGRHTDKLALMEGRAETIVADDTTSDKFDSDFEVCVEASGSPSGLMMAAAVTTPLGTVVLKTTCAADSSFNTAPFVVKELKIVGSRCGNFPMALEALQKGWVCPEKMVSKVYPFSQAVQALEHAAQRGTLKIQLLFPDKGKC